MTMSDALHPGLIVFDGHLDIPTEFGEPGYEVDRDGPGQFDLVKAKRGGLSGACICLSAPLGRDTPEGRQAGQAVQEKKLAAVERMIALNPHAAALATSPAQFREVAASGRLAVVLALQNAAPFNGDLDGFDTWAARGVQMMALTFIGNNAFADSSRPYPFAGDHRNGGLSDRGRAAIARMNDLGVVVDVSQLSAEALADTLDVTRAPLVASHSAPRGVLKTRRNLADDELKAIAATGGMVNVVGFANYLAPTDLDVQEELSRLWVRYGLMNCKTTDDAIFHPDTATWEDEKFWNFMHEFHDVLDLGDPHASVSHLVDAVEYVVDRIGIEHVGLSSDFNHGGGLIGWRNAGETPNVTAELARRGFSEENIGRLWGQNFLRVWEEVQIQGGRGKAAA